MDGTGEPPSGAAPAPAAIRRALAECMTLADIDDVMGWATGTARKRRWLDPTAGGLPPADAELGGVALWFRSTITRWRAQHRDAAAPQVAPPPPAAAPDDAGDAEPDAEPEPDPDDEDPDDEDPDDEDPDDEADPDEADPPDPGRAERRAQPAAPEPEPAAESAEPEPAEPEPAAEPDPAGPDRPVGEPPPGRPVRSGLELAVGQHVLALVHRTWRPAVVRSRDRRTVLVDYRLDATALGGRQQRLTVDRLRVHTED